jgi:hypothetical protein
MAYNVKDYFKNYMDNGAQQAVVVVGAVTLLGAALRYQRGLSPYGSYNGSAARHGSAKRKKSAYNSFIAKEVPRLMAQGMSATQAMKKAAKNYRK